MNSTEYIYQPIEEGEHQHQDFKFEISDARKIAKTLSGILKYKWRTVAGGSERQRENSGNSSASNRLK